jgi:hypothetical protein
MAATVAGCVLCFRALCAEVDFMRNEDASIVPLPFNEVASRPCLAARAGPIQTPKVPFPTRSCWLLQATFSDRRRLTVGMLCDNNFFDVTPACERAVTLAAAALEARGTTGGGGGDAGG